MSDTETIGATRVFGHRGAAGHAPENTIASFRKAAELGVRQVEFDVRLTRDGHAVVFHDDTLGRTTNGDGRVAETDLSGLKMLDAGGWFDAAYAGETIPTLAEVIAALAGLGLAANVELKPTPGRERETGETAAAVLRTRWPATLPPPLLSSFDAQALAAAGAAAPDLPRALLVEAIPADWRGAVEELGCAALHCAHRHLSRKRAHQVLDAGYKLRCFTVNERARAETLFSWGVESVFSDYPDRVLGAASG